MDGSTRGHVRAAAPLPISWICMMAERAGFNLLARPCVYGEVCWHGDEARPPATHRPRVCVCVCVCLIFRRMLLLLLFHIAAAAFFLPVLSVAAVGIDDSDEGDAVYSGNTNTQQVWVVKCVGVEG